VLLFFVVLSAAIAGAIGGLRGGGGDPVATLDLSRGPSSAPVSLRAGDLLRVRADLEFRHRASQLRGNPDGCEVTLSLREGTAMLKRVWGFDALTCTGCGGRMRFIAVIKDRAVIERILKHIGEDAEEPKFARARDPCDLWA
jgi:hypothetical protein